MVPAANLNALREQFTCPISYSLLQDPVIERCVEGRAHVFERAWIREWLATHQTCPLSRRPLVEGDLDELPGIRAACALLDPGRVDPLSPEDLEQIARAAELLQAPPPRVDEAIHTSILARLARMAVAGTRATGDCLRRAS